jgi:hypothetical protein
MLLCTWIQTALALDATESLAPHQEVMAEWDLDWAWWHGAGQPRAARVPANPPVHPLALTTLGAERDLAGMVLARTQALAGSLAGRADLGTAKDGLMALEAEAAKTPRTDAAARKALYLKACAVRRQVMMAHPKRGIDKIIFAWTHLPQLNFYLLNYWAQQMNSVASSRGAGEVAPALRAVAPRVEATRCWTWLLGSPLRAACSQASPNAQQSIRPQLAGNAGYVQHPCR